MSTGWNGEEGQTPTSNNGLEGGWPVVGTVWQGHDGVTGRFQRVRVEENLSRSFFEENLSADFDEDDPVRPEQYVHEGASSVVVLDPGPDDPDADLISWPQFGTAYTWIPDDPDADPATATTTLTGIGGGRPIEGTVWAGLGYSGEVEAFRVDLNLLDSGAAVTVDVDPDTNEAGMASWPAFGTAFTWIPDHPQASVAPPDPAQLQTVVSDHDPADLSQGWQALRPTSGADTQAAEGEGTEPTASEDDDIAWHHEQSEQPARGRHL